MRLLDAWETVSKTNPFYDEDETRLFFVDNKHVIKAITPFETNDMHPAAALEWLAAETNKGLYKQKRILKNGTTLFLLRRMHGMTIADHMEKKGPSSQTRLANIRSAVMKQLGDVYRYGMYHLDVSPFNVFLEKDGTITLFDWGMMGWCTDARDPGPDFVIQTHGYDSPELTDGDAVHESTDLWSLGMTLLSAEKCIDFNEFLADTEDDKRASFYRQMVPHLKSDMDKDDLLQPYPQNRTTLRRVTKEKGWWPALSTFAFSPTLEVSNSTIRAVRSWAQKSKMPPIGVAYTVALLRRHGLTATGDKAELASAWSAFRFSAYQFMSEYIPATDATYTDSRLQRVDLWDSFRLLLQRDLVVPTAHLFLWRFYHTVIEPVVGKPRKWRGEFERVSDKLLYFEAAHETPCAIMGAAAIYAATRKFVDRLDLLCTGLHVDMPLVEAALADFEAFEIRKETARKNKSARKNTSKHKKRKRR